MAYGQHYRARLEQAQQPQHEYVAEPEHDPPPQHRPMPRRQQYAERTFRNDVNVRNVTVPLVLVFTGAASIVFATYVLTSNMADIKYSIKDMQEQLTRYVNSTAERITRVEAEIDKMKGNSWSIRDQALWCSQQEVQNQGWKCVPPSMPGGSKPPAGWTPRD